MTKKNVLRLGILLVAFVVIFLWIRKSPSTKTLPTSKPDATNSKSSKRSTLHFERTISVRGGTLELEGQVVNETMIGIANAEVTINTRPLQKVRSQEDGTFVFKNLLPRRYILIAKSATGVAGPQMSYLSKDSDPVILRLKTGAAVKISVVNSNGAPIKDAEVSLRSRIAENGKTDKDGTISFSPIVSGRYHIAAIAPGFAKGFAMFFVAPGAGDYKRRITLYRGAKASGRVVSSSGTPIAGARVLYMPTPRQRSRPRMRFDSIETNGRGEFEIPALKAGQYRFVARHSKYAPGRSDEIVIDGISSKTGITITLKEGAQISGRVININKEPIPWATIRISKPNQNAETRSRRRRRRRGQRGQTVTCDNKGRFTIEGLPKQRIALVAQGQKGSSETTFVDLSQEGTKRNLELVVTILGEISGVVVDNEGNIIEGAQVFARPDFRGGARSSPSEWRARGRASAVTDAGGRFALYGLQEDFYILRASRDLGNIRRRGRSSDSGQAEVKVGNTNVRIVLPLNGEIRGKVLFSDGNAPNHYSVQTAFRGMGVPFSNKNGEFKMTEVIPGTYTLRINGAEFTQKQIQSIEVKPGETTNIGTVTVAKGRIISGIVIDESGTPFANARVILGRNLTSFSADINASRRNQLKETTTSEDGTFKFHGVPEGDIALMATHEQRKSPTQYIRRNQSSVSGLTLQLNGIGKARGTVTYSNGTPIPQAIVSAQPQQAPNVKFLATTDNDGKFAFNSLAPDKYIFSAVLGENIREGFGVYSKTESIQSGSTTEIMFKINEGEIDIVVTLKANNESVGFAQIIRFEGSNDAKTASELNLLLASIGEGSSSRSFVIRGQPVVLMGIKPGVHTICAIPLPSNIIAPRGAGEYIERQGDTLPVFCEKKDILINPDTQTVTIAVQIPKYIESN